MGGGWVTMNDVKELAFGLGNINGTVPLLARWIQFSPPSLPCKSSPSL